MVDRFWPVKNRIPPCALLFARTGAPNIEAGIVRCARRDGNTAPTEANNAARDPLFVASDAVRVGHAPT